MIVNLKNEELATISTAIPTERGHSSEARALSKLICECLDEPDMSAYDIISVTNS